MKEVGEMAEFNAKAKEIGKEIVISGIMAGLIDFFRDVFGKKIPQGIEKKFVESRDEMLTFIQGLDDRLASKNLLERWKKRQLCKPRSYGEKEKYKYGDEIDFAERLTKLYKSLDEPQERWQRVEMFKWFGRMNDEEFDLFIEFLNHDVVIQWLKKSWGWVKEIWGKLYSTDAQNPGLCQKMKVGQKFEEFVDSRLKTFSEIQNLNESIFSETENPNELLPKLKEVSSRLQDDIKAEKKGITGKTIRRWTSLWSF